jgi:CheY-like chemotaxis protein
VQSFVLPSAGTHGATGAFRAWAWGRSMQLKNVRVLLVEDDPLIALDLRQTLEAEGATVVGPRTLSLASDLLVKNTIDVAVLDHLIVGGDSLPLADELSRLGLGFLFHTSHRGVIPQRYPDVPVIDKPSRRGELVAAVKPWLRWLRGAGKLPTEPCRRRSRVSRQGKRDRCQPTNLMCRRRKLNSPQTHHHQNR